MLSATSRRAPLARTLQDLCFLATSSSGVQMRGASTRQTGFGRRALSIHPREIITLTAAQAYHDMATHDGTAGMVGYFFALLLGLARSH
jgi:hypothetical protein